MTNFKIVRIIVRDIKGNSISNAKLTIMRAPQMPAQITAFSDSSGQIDMSISAIGQYELDCAAAGYESRSVSVMIADDAVSVVTITPRPCS